MVLLDTNYIVRYLLNDIPEQYAEAERVLLNENVVIMPEVLLESIHVLMSIYKVSKTIIANRLMTIINCENVVLSDKQACLRTLSVFKTSPLSYTDCLLIETAIDTGQEIKSFDKQLLSHHTKRKHD